MLSIRRSHSLATAGMIVVAASMVGCREQHADAAASGVVAVGGEAGDSGWQLLWRIGGTESDTLLIQPSRLVRSRNLLMVLDLGRRSVTALDYRTGALRWIFGHDGSGPGELELPQAAASLRDGRTAVFDAGNRRLIVLTDSGRATGTTGLATVGQIHSFCEVRDGEFLALVAAPAEPLVTVDRQGTRLTGASLPWAGVAALDPVAQTVQFTRLPSASGCVMSSQSTPFWSVRTGPQWTEMHRYADSSPAVPDSAPADLSSGVSMPDDSTVMISVLPPRGERGAVLRRFSLRGEPRGEWRLPTPPVNRIVWHEAVGDTVFVLHGINGMPALSAFVRQRPTH